MTDELEIIFVANATDALHADSTACSWNPDQAGYNMHGSDFSVIVG
jgi:hypothetical protein